MKNKKSVSKMVAITPIQLRAITLKMKQGNMFKAKQMLRILNKRSPKRDLH